jgi:hypothetical protein
LWFVWHDGAVFVNSLSRSRRARDLAAGSPVALCVDLGDSYGELRGAVLSGRLEDAGGDPRLDSARALFAGKYFGGADLPPLRSHVWLVLRPKRVVSWDFRKIPPGKDRRLEATRG